MDVIDTEYILKNRRYKIKKDITTRNKYYCVMQNPFRDYWDTRVLYGGSIDIVQRKISRQYTKFEIENKKLKGEIINE